MSRIHTLRQRVLKHLLVGGALASTGCIVKDEATPEGERGDAASGDGGGTDARITDARITDARIIDASLYPPPPACASDCCALFDAPAGEDGLCLEAEHPDIYPLARAAMGPDDFEGGCCLYSISGPYAAEAAGACTYRVEGDENCPVIGRPFYVAKVARVAALIPSTAWL
ncbi:hypothetical protein KKB55_03360 [Myxococcota bacterium]|nr:hypothetical protein [Myxococcota bacterium]MBU1896791.1 hypothetical protein [Myxococcota bacterium]